MTSHPSPPHRPLAFIFDLDGTLVDSGRDIALSANHVRRHFALPELELATARSYVGDGVVKLLERALGHDSASGQTGTNGLPVTPDQLQEGLREFQQHYRAHLLDHTVLYPGVVAVLDRLQDRLQDLVLCVATNKPRGFTDAILAGLGLEGRFARIVGGDETPARKPDPAHLAVATVGLGVTPPDVVMVGDSPNDVHAAQAFGAVSVGCTFGLVPRDVVAASGPDHLLDRFSDLPGLFDI